LFDKTIKRKTNLKNKNNDTSQKEGIRQTMIPFENEGVLNPAAIKGNFVHLFIILCGKATIRL
jgi:hypothetical protein